MPFRIFPVPFSTTNVGFDKSRDHNTKKWSFYGLVFLIKGLALFCASFFLVVLSLLVRISPAFGQEDETESPISGRVGISLMNPLERYPASLAVEGGFSYKAHTAWAGIMVTENKILGDQVGEWISAKEPSSSVNGGFFRYDARVWDPSEKVDLRLGFDLYFIQNTDKGERKDLPTIDPKDPVSFQAHRNIFGVSNILTLEYRPLQDLILQFGTFPVVYMKERATLWVDGDKKATAQKNGFNFFAQRLAILYAF